MAPTTTVGEIDMQKAQAAKLEEENKRISEEKESLSKKLNERFDELAVLTNMLAARDKVIRTKNQLHLHPDSRSNTTLYQNPAPGCGLQRRHFEGSAQLDPFLYLRHRDIVRDTITDQTGLI